MESYAVNGNPEETDQVRLSKNASPATGLPREERGRSSYLQSGRGSNERDEVSVHSNGARCCDGARDSTDGRHNSDVSAPGGRQPSGMSEPMYSEQTGFTGHRYSHSDTSEDTVDNEYILQGEEEIITETEEVCKNKVVLTASVVIIPEAWKALRRNNNLKKCLPADVRLQQSSSRENECEGVEVIGCWRSVDVVISLAAEAWMATQSRHRLREKTREQQETKYDPNLYGEEQLTNQRRNPKNAAHEAMRAAIPPAGLGRGEMAREKKDPELNQDRTQRELMTDHRGNGRQTDKNATAPVGLGRGEITREQSSPELGQGRAWRTDHGDKGSVTNIDIASSEDVRDIGVTSQQRHPESDRTGKEHMNRNQQNADEEMSSGNENPDSNSERSSRNPMVHVKSRKQVGSDRRKNRTFSKLECEMGKVFFTENLILKVYEGDITSLSGVDCIVNSTDQHLKHGGGAALAIKNAAGPDFEKECGKCKDLDVGKCVSTGAGNLRYKKVLHVTLPVWNSFDKNGCLKALQKSLEAALQKARTEKMKCMALSGIGTGVQRFPKDKWVYAVVETIMKHSKEKKPLEEIHFVDTNTELLRLLKMHLSKAFPSSTKEMFPPQESSSRGHMPQGVSSQRVSSKETVVEVKPAGQESRLTAGKEIDMGLPAVFDITSSCKLVVDQKSLVNFHGDAIGVTDGIYMLGLGPLSESIASAAGQSYVSEKRMKWNAKVGHIVVTKAGKLHFQHILHGIISPAYVVGKHDFISLVQNMLAEASHLKVKALAVPALCTGFSGLPVKEGCDLLVAEICEFAKKDTQCTLKEIHILDIDPKKVEKLCMSVSKLESERLVFRTKPSALMTSQLQNPSPLGAAKSSSADITSPAQNLTVPVTKTCRVTVQNKALTDFIGDAIVITIAELYPLRGMHSVMSERVSAIAGEKYEKEIRKISDKYLPPMDVITTRAGNLRCKYILHAVQNTFIDKAGLKALVKAVLTQADIKQLRTVAFPAIWAETGSSGYSSHEWLEIFVAEIYKFLQNYPTCSLQEIHIMDTDEDRVQEVCHILRKQLSREMLMEPGTMVQVTHTYSVENGARPKQDVLHEDQISGAYTVCYICNNANHNPIHRCDCGRQICIRCKVNLHSCSFDQRNKKATKATITATVATPGEKSQSEPSCVICLSTIKRPEKLPCGHVFCKDCIQLCFEKGYKLCPVCKAVCGVVIGDQPKGRMDISKTYTSCEGYEGFGSIVINYIIPDGIQEDCHPHPAKPYKGLQRMAYLPNNREGIKVLKLLQQAFDQRLIFTIGRSVTTGKDDVVTWNDIHHKTAQRGGSEKFGYPDPGYLSRVQEELQAKGIGRSSHEGSPV